MSPWLDTPHWFSAGERGRGKSRVRLLCSFGATFVCTSPNHPPASVIVTYFLDFPPETRSTSGNGDWTEQLQEWAGISEPVLQRMLAQNGGGWKGPVEVTWSKQSPTGSGQTVSRWFLNISKDGKSKTSSDNPCQCSVTLTIVLPIVQICISHKKAETETRLSEKLKIHTFSPTWPG